MEVRFPCLAASDPSLAWCAGSSSIIGVGVRESLQANSSPNTRLTEFLAVRFNLSARSFIYYTKTFMKTVHLAAQEPFSLRYKVASNERIKLKRVFWGWEFFSSPSLDDHQPIEPESCKPLRDPVEFVTGWSEQQFEFGTNLTTIRSTGYHKAAFRGSSACWFVAGTHKLKNQLSPW